MSRQIGALMVNDIPASQNLSDSSLQPKSIYKYFSKPGLLRFLKAFTVRFSPLYVFNDPFEARPVIGTPEEWDSRRRDAQNDGVDVSFDENLIADRMDVEEGVWGLRTAIMRSIGAKVGVLALTEDPTNILMWAHYSDCHRGGVVEFDCSDSFFQSDRSDQGLINLFRKVTYQQQRPLLNFEFFRQNRIIPSDQGRSWLNLLKDSHPLFFTKSEDWAYEREWRLVRQLADPLEHDSKSHSSEQLFTGRHINDDYWNSPPPEHEITRVPIKCVRSITLGVNSTTYTGTDRTFENEVWEMLTAHPEADHIRLRKARVHEEDFKVVTFDLQSAQEVKANVSRQDWVTRKEGFSGIPFRS